jgi:hypothetical protein
MVATDLVPETRADMRNDVASLAIIATSGLGTSLFPILSTSTSPAAWKLASSFDDPLFYFSQFSLASSYPWSDHPGSAAKFGSCVGWGYQYVLHLAGNVSIKLLYI